MMIGTVVAHACLASKNYFMFNDEDGKIVCTKRGFKGVNCKSKDYLLCDRLLDEEILNAYGF